MIELGQNLFNGFVASGIYLLIALGITIVFGLTRLINFAHGEFLVGGTFIAFTATSHGYPFWMAFMASTILIGALAFVLERAAFQWTLANPLNGLILGLGVLIVGQYLVVRIWGTDAVSVTSWVSGTWDLRGVSLSYDRLVVLGLTVLMAGAMLLLLHGTPMGRRMSATQADPLAAAHVGINVGRVITIAFVVGSALAGSAGAVLGTLFPIDAFQGGNIILKGFAVALLGGLGNVRGAIVASLVYGVGETMVAGYWDPSWVPLFTFGIIILILLVRPGGLFGAPSDTSMAAQFGERMQVSVSRSPQLPLAGRLVVIAGCVAVPVVVFHLLPTSRLQAVFVLAAIYAVVVYALSLLYHQSGMLSVAHGGLMAVGAYTAALLAVHYSWGFWMSLLPAFVLSAAAGALVGVPVARARGHYFLLLTFAFGSLVVVLIQNMKSLTAGDQGLEVLDPPGNLGPVTFDGLTNEFYLALGFAVAAGACVWMVSRSPLGARLLAIRENESLARSVGLNVALYKVISFTISGGIAGLAGVLFLYHETVIVPDSFTVLASIQFVIMLVLGGRSILGPAVGVTVIVLIPEVLGLDPETKQLVYGLVLCAVILLVPRGVVPTLGHLLDLVFARLRPAVLHLAPDHGASLSEATTAWSLPRTSDQTFPSGGGTTPRAGVAEDPR